MFLTQRRRHGERAETRPCSYGLDKHKLHLAGAQQEMEMLLEGLPPEARIGTWVMEWYWKQPRGAATSPISSTR